MNHHLTWILVADGGSARILQYENSIKPLIQIDGGYFEHIHSPNHDLISSDRGRGSNANRTGRHALEWQTDPHQQQKKLFAKELVQYLKAHQDNFERLILVAPPKMLGNIRDEITPHLGQKVYGHETKDLTRVSLNQIPDHLQGLLNWQKKAA